MRITLVMLTMLGGVGCGGSRDGTYLLAVTSVSENTCPWEDEDLVDIGSATVLVFSDMVTVGDLVFDRSGDFFGASYENTYDSLDPCFVKEDIEYDGFFLSKSSFTLDVEASAYLEGDCSSVDTTGFPCSYDLTVDAGRVD